MPFACRRRIGGNDGSTAPLSRRWARHLAETLGLTQRTADRVVDDLLVKLSHLADDIESGILPFSDRVNRAVARGLAYRHRQPRA